MTRFARAKGSKASNERLKEEPTPWHVMKQQLDESLNKVKPIEEKTKTAKQLLEEKEIAFPSNNDWAEFDISKTNKNTIKLKGSCKIEKPTDKKIKKKKLKDSFQKQIENNTDRVADVSEKLKTKKQVIEENEKLQKSKKKFKRTESQVDPSSDSVSPKKKTLSKNDVNETSKDELPPKKKKNNNISEKSEVNSPSVSEESKKKKFKSSESQLDSSLNSTPQKKKKLSKTDINETSKDEVPPKKKKNNNVSENSEKNTPSVSEEPKTKPTEKLSKRQKRNLKKKNQNTEIEIKKNTESNKSVFDTEDNDWNSDVKFGNSTKAEKKPGPFNPVENNSEKSFQNQNNVNQERFGRFGGQRPNMKNHHLRKPKVKDDKEHKRRKPVQSSKLMINGMEIEVVMFDGFPIQKEDAERLKELRQKMILKGIPKSEIDAAMKIERRRAEKALTRVRKQVCFHCRKAGHNLSDCPELGREESVTGICFKCGSTEHTHFECKVTKSDDYRYATCFICREPGHIAKQCPDNPKGLYPKGGACKICGDVTHLKKDCPDAAREKEETTITVKTITDSALESIDEEGKKPKPIKEPKQKIVKF